MRPILLLIISFISTITFSQKISYDSSFADNGVFLLKNQAKSGFIASVEFDDNDNVYTFGRGTTDTGGFYFTMMKLFPDGKLDLAFGDNGVIAHNFEGYSFDARHTFQQDDGKFLVTGQLYRWNEKLFLPGLLRVNQDGSLDESFGNGGLVYKEVDTNYWATNVLQNDDKKIFIIGHTKTGENNVITLFRLNEDGSDDETFGVGGAISYKPSPPYLHLECFYATFTKDHSVLINGWASDDSQLSNLYFLKINFDGIKQNNFSTNGENFVAYHGNNKSIRTYIDNSDNILFTGVYDTFDLEKFEYYRIPFIGKLNPDGSSDQNFGSNGFTNIASNFGTRNTAKSVNVLSDGNLVCGMEYYKEITDVRVGYRLFDQNGFQFPGVGTVPDFFYNGINQFYNNKVDKHDNIWGFGFYYAPGFEFSFLTKHNYSPPALKRSVIKLDFKVYPTVVTNYCIIDANDIEEYVTSIDLYSVNGKIIKNLFNKKSQISPFKNISFNLEGLNAGSYYLKVSTLSTSKTVNIIKI